MFEFMNRNVFIYNLYQRNYICQIDENETSKFTNK